MSLMASERDKQFAGSSTKSSASLLPLRFRNYLEPSGANEYLAPSDWILRSMNLDEIGDESLLENPLMGLKISLDSIGFPMFDSFSSRSSNYRQTPTLCRLTESSPINPCCQSLKSQPHTVAQRRP